MKRQPLISTVLIVLIFFTTLISGVQLSRNIQGGVYDEVAHADMVYQTFTGGFTPASGATIDDWTLVQAACRGFIPASPSFEDCELGTYRVNDLAKDGLNTASGYPPVYYLVSAYLAKVLDVIDGDEQITWTRMRNINISIFAVGILLSFFLFRTVGASLTQSSFGAIWLASIPIAMYQGATINPESMAFLAASGLCIVALRANFSARSAFLVGLSSSLVFLIKPSFLFAVVAGIAIYALRSYQDQEFSTRNLIRFKRMGLFSLIGGFFLPLMAWTLYSAQTSVLDKSSTYGNTTFGQLANEIPFWNRYLIGVTQYLDIARDVTNRELIDTSIGYRLAVITSLLLVCYVFVKGFLSISSKLSDTSDFILLAVFISIATTTAVLIIATEQLTNIFYVSSRYALPLLPIALAAFMIEIRKASLPSKTLLGVLVIAQTTWLLPYFS